MAEQQTVSGDTAGEPRGELLPPNSLTETSFQKPLAFVAAGEKISVFLGELLLAESRDVIVVHEQGHSQILYFPRGDVHLDLAKPVDQSTHCPRKGDASYLEFVGDDSSAMAWTYESPIPPAMILKDYLAFYPDNLEFRKEA